MDTESREAVEYFDSIQDLDLVSLYHQIRPKSKTEEEARQTLTAWTALRTVIGSRVRSAMEH